MRHPQVKAAGDKVTGAAKDATGNSSGPLQGAAGDAKSALGDAKQVRPQPNPATFCFVPNTSPHLVVSSICYVLSTVGFVLALHNAVHPPWLSLGPSGFHAAV